jgi:putative addiction module component (TIGR02574 family)
VTRDTRDLLDKALKLPREERANLAAELIASLDEKEDPAVVERTWRDEIVRRARDVLEGRDPGKPAEEVFARLRAKRHRA